MREEILRTTLQSIGDGVIATDVEARVTLMNPVAEALTAWTQAEAVGKPFDEVFQIINEVTRRPAESPRGRVFREGVVVGLADGTVLIARDGTERPIADYAAPIRDANGAITGMVLIFRDQTKDREAERAVEAARAYAESIVQTLREPLLVLDADLRVISANRSFYKTFQVSEDQTEGQLVYDLGNQQWDIPRLRQLLEDILPTNNSFDDFEVEYDSESTGQRTMLLNARRICTELDHTEMILLGIEDVTERRRAQTALCQAEEELVRKERRAVLGELASGVGHELRNPLGAIKNAAYFLNMAVEDATPEVKESLEIIEREIGTSEMIISSLLDLAGPKELARRKVKINDVVRDALSRTVVPEGVEVRVEPDDELPAIPADAAQLGHVFSNLILNAYQAMPSGGRLTIRAEACDREWAVVRFADTGDGISKDSLPKVFEPLFTTKATGIGLGLALSKTLVERHGGSIDIDSEPGKGTTLTVRLPMNGKESE